MYERERENIWDERENICDERRRERIQGGCRLWLMPAEFSGRGLTYVGT